MAVQTASHRAAAPAVLSPAYYARLFQLEEAHGWQRGMAAYNTALLAPIVARRPGLRVLDSGCGTGGLMTWLRARGADVVGVDVAPEGLQFSRHRGHRGLAQGSSLELPFTAASFDLVVCTDVLQHLPTPPGDGAALAEAYRVLRPGGYLYVRTNSGCGEGAPVERSSAYRRYLRADLRRRIEQAGFHVARCTYANALPALPTLLRRRVRALTTRDHGDNHGHDHHHAAAYSHARAADPGLRLRTRPAGLRWIDTVLATVLKVEASVVASPGWAQDWPFGDSLLALARKPDDSGTSTRG